MRVGLPAALLVTLAVPSTRELQVLLARLLFDVRDAHTFVQGQPPGCGVYIVPDAQFREPYIRGLGADAATSPDAFVIARYSLGPRLQTPPVEHWANHPLVEWATFDLVQRTVRPLCTEDAESVGNGDDPTGRAWVLTRQAQREHPDNGALWIAEAGLHFYQGRSEEALEALRIAAEKPEWNSQRAASVLYAADLLQAAGLPRFDAVTDAWSRWYPQGQIVARKVQEHIHDMMTAAVVEGDDTRFSVLARQLRSLQDGLWEGSVVPNGFQAWPYLHDATGLVGAMADRLGIAVPAYDEMEYEQARVLRDRVLGDYLHRYLEDRPAGELLAADADYRRRTSNTILLRDPAFYTALKGAMGGAMGLLILAYGISALLVELAFRQGRRGFTVQRDQAVPRGWVFRVASGFACLSVILLMFSAFDSVCQPVGLGSAVQKHLLSPSQQNLLMGALVGVGWTIGRMLIRGRPRWLKCNTVMLVVLGYAYVAVIALTAHFRNETVRLIYEEIARGWPA